MKHFFPESQRRVRLGRLCGDGQQRTSSMYTGAFSASSSPFHHKRCMRLQLTLPLTSRAKNIFRTYFGYRVSAFNICQHFKLPLLFGPLPVGRLVFSTSTCIFVCIAAQFVANDAYSCYLETILAGRKNLSEVVGFDYEMVWCTCLFEQA